MTGTDAAKRDRPDVKLQHQKHQAKGSFLALAMLFLHFLQTREKEYWIFSINTILAMGYGFSELVMFF